MSRIRRSSSVNHDHKCQSIRRRRCAGEAALSTTMMERVERLENSCEFHHFDRIVTSSLFLSEDNRQEKPSSLEDPEKLVKTSSVSKKKRRWISWMEKTRGKKYPYGLSRRRFRDTLSICALLYIYTYIHMTSAFSQTLLVHLANDLIAANYNRSFLRSPLLFIIQRVCVRACRRA